MDISRWLFLFLTYAIILCILPVKSRHAKRNVISDDLQICCQDGQTAANPKGICGDLQEKHFTKNNARNTTECKRVFLACCDKEQVQYACDAGKQAARSGSSCYHSSLTQNDAYRRMFIDCCTPCHAGIDTATRTKSCVKNTIMGKIYESVFSQCCEEKLRVFEVRLRDRCPTTNMHCPSVAHQCVDPGPTQQLRCECREGFKEGFVLGEGSSCIDIDECQIEPPICPEGTECINNEGSFDCRSLAISPMPTVMGRKSAEGQWAIAKPEGSQHCPDGRREDPNDSRHCVDIDECEEKNPCEGATVCHNLAGGYTCLPDESQAVLRTTVNQKEICAPGLQNDHGRCIDIDECSIGSHACNLTYEICENLHASHRCIAKVDSSISKKESELRIRYPESSTATPTCLEGRRFVNGYCEDINECKEFRNPCAPNHNCINTEGSFKCISEYCPSGYEFDIVSNQCQDINECISGIHNCNLFETCMNTNGSFFCAKKGCPFGLHMLHNGTCAQVDCGQGMQYNDDEMRCEDYNECLRSPCLPSQECINTHGSFECVSRNTCGQGFEKGDDDECRDINECLAPQRVCPGEQFCENTFGSFVCKCHIGHKKSDNGSCIDIDECHESSHVCPSQSKCVNIVGSFYCLCDKGFKQSEASSNLCMDINECLNDLHDCSHGCFNTIGSYECRCPPGYSLGTDGKTCHDIDECREDNRNRWSLQQKLCDGTCTNTLGSYKCQCPKGYKLNHDGRTCDDIDECETDPLACSDEEICLNTRGFYKCFNLTCPTDYVRDRSFPK